ncbi:MAG: hypothetical protein GWO24_24415, partial [Akkermansiaceae bacterium]|nr:hypothetical protein [Akkermansiaceae bacterium]
EKWIPGASRDQETEALLQRRDLDCYRPDSGKKQLAAEERKKIIAHLRTRALAAAPALVILLALAAPIHATAAAPVESGALYRQAGAAWTEGS